MCYLFMKKIRFTCICRKYIRITRFLRKVIIICLRYKESYMFYLHCRREGSERNCRLRERARRRESRNNWGFTEDNQHAMATGSLT